MNWNLNFFSLSTDAASIIYLSSMKGEMLLLTLALIRLVKYRLWNSWSLIRSYCLLLTRFELIRLLRLFDLTLNLCLFDLKFIKLKDFINAQYNDVIHNLQPSVSIPISVCAGKIHPFLSSSMHIRWPWHDQFCLAVSLISLWCWKGGTKAEKSEDSQFIPAVYYRISL